MTRDEIESLRKDLATWHNHVASRSDRLAAQTRIRAAMPRLLDIASAAEALDLSTNTYAEVVARKSWRDFNVNHSVRIKLTDRGREIVADLDASNVQNIPGYTGSCLPPPNDEGWVLVQMHDLMSIFGHAMIMGRPVPFETNIQIEDVVPQEYTPCPRKVWFDTSKGWPRPPVPSGNSLKLTGLDWAVERWNEEVKNRPLVNVHRRTLDDMWRQAIRYFGGDPEALVGPAHDDLVAASPDKAIEQHWRVATFSGATIAITDSELQFPDPSLFDLIVRQGKVTQWPEGWGRASAEEFIGRASKAGVLT